MSINRLKTLTFGYFTGVAGLVTSGLFYTRNIENTKPETFPVHFKQLIHNNPAALYSRKLKTDKSLQDLTKILFSQPFYDLELVISDTQFDSETFSLVQGSKIGHMQVESIYENEVIFRYLFEDFNYRVFLKKEDDQIKLGYVEYSGSRMEDIGCQIYMPLLLEGLAKRV